MKHKQVKSLFKLRTELSENAAPQIKYGIWLFLLLEILSKSEFGTKMLTMLIWNFQK